MAQREDKDSFGETIRSLRKAKGISLRKFAEKVGMSATYLSKVERDEFRPPAEDKVRAMAKELDQDPDELLALADRVASDLSEIIKKHPREMATFLRTVKSLPKREIEVLTKAAKKKGRPDHTGRKKGRRSSSPKSGA